MTQQLARADPSQLDGAPTRPTRHVGMWLVVGLGFGAVHCVPTTQLTSEFALNHAGQLELREATHPRPQAPKDQLLVKYLRAGGVYFEWQGQALMTAPFATNYPMLRWEWPLSSHRYRRIQQKRHAVRHLFNTQLAPNRRALAHVLGDDLELDWVRWVLVGHSHYDHLGDVVPLLTEFTKRATLYVNQSGKHMLAGEPELAGRVVSLQNTELLPARDPEQQQWIRFRAILSEHAPNMSILGLPVRWAPNQVTEDWKQPLDQHKLRDLQEGTTYAFLIDFLDPATERVVYRVHYQDAASRPPLGYPQPAWLEQRPVDLAVVCMPGRETLPPEANRYPVGLLKHTGARHALVIHYEDFFRSVDSPVALISTLRDRTASNFLHATHTAIHNPATDVCSSQSPEGLCSAAFTVPLPGQWLRFNTDLSRKQHDVVER